MTLNIRMTEALKNHVQATADHVGSNRQRVLKAVCRSYLNSRPVVQFNVSELYYKPGNQIISVRGLDGKIVADDEFRKYIYRRCQEEREKKVRIFRSYAAEAGISTRPPETLEEARQMACYVEA